MGGNGAAVDDPADVAPLPAGYRDLTPRELEVFRLLTPHNRPIDIAATLGISTDTVRNHVKNGRAKLGNVAALVAARTLAELEGRNQFSASQHVAMSVGDTSRQPAATWRRRARSLRWFRSHGAPGNDLTAPQRIVGIFLAATFLAIAFGMLAVGGSVVSDAIRVIRSR